MVTLRLGHELTDPDGTFAAAYGLGRRRRDDRPAGRLRRLGGPAAKLSAAIEQLTGLSELVGAASNPENLTLVAATRLRIGVSRARASVTSGI